jgi:hypothetical protein
MHQQKQWIEGEEEDFFHSTNRHAEKMDIESLDSQDTNGGGKGCAYRKEYADRNAQNNK